MILKNAPSVGHRPALPNAKFLRSVDSFPLSREQDVISKQWLRVLCGDQTLNPERTEHLRDLSVEALEARRSQRHRWVAAHGRAKFMASSLIIAIKPCSSLNRDDTDSTVS